MRLFLSRFPALAVLFVFVLLCAAMAKAEFFQSHTATLTTTADGGPGSLLPTIAAAGDANILCTSRDTNPGTAVGKNGTIPNHRRRRNMDGSVEWNEEYAD